MDKKITLHIYDKSGRNVIKMYEAEPFELPFGTVRKLMAIAKIEDLKDQGQLLKVIADAWDEIISILGAVFPECTEEELDSVKAKEVLSVVIQIAKAAISDIFIIPTEKN